MEVLNKVFKGFAVTALVIVGVGCASLDNMARSQLKNQNNMPTDGTDIIYGMMSSYSEKDTAQLCAAIQNADPKCNDSNYQIISMVSAFGFSAAAYYAFTWVPVDLNYHKCSRLGDSDCTFGKARLVEGRFADLVEVVSENKDGKCKWSGLPRAGGIVCPAYNWDYRKNLNDWNTTSGITTIKKK